MPPSKKFAFICGPDDFLVGRLAQERFDKLAAGVTDEFARDVLNGFAANVDEVTAAVNRFRESIQTMPLFGGTRAVWLRDINFLADTQTGRAEGTLKAVEDLQEILEGLDPAQTAVLLSAAPVDRRRSFAKWCEKQADFALAGGEAAGSPEALADLANGEARGLGVSFGRGALDLLIARIGANSRLIVEETRKLAAFAGDGSAIEEAHVTELTPNVAEGDFFEMAEAFYSGDLAWTLAALRRHFFAGGDARPLISALQNRNRIFLQIRALADSGEIRVGGRGVEGLAAAGAAHAAKFEGAPGKSAYNLFTQNPWYLGKLVGSGRLPPLRRLIDNQREFVTAFEEITRRPNDAEEVLRDLSVRCLAAA